MTEIILAIVLIIFIIVFIPCTRIYTYKKNEKNRKGTEILSIKNYSDTYSGKINLVIALILAIIYVIYIFMVYNYLKDYLDNAFQLLDYQYVQSLNGHFIERGFFHFLAFDYLGITFFSIFWIIDLLVKATIDFYMGGKDIKIYNGGMFISEKFYLWNEIASIKWSAHESFFKKEKYYKLALSSISIIVKHEDKDSVNDILIKFIEENNKKEEFRLKFTPFPIIPTDRLKLRKLKQEDKNEIYYLKSNDEILKYLDNKKHETFEETEKYINKINGGITRNEAIVWGITLSGSDKVVGTICLWNIAIENKTGEVGYDLMPEYQGKGIMDEALGAILKYAFNFIKFKTIKAYTHKDNLSSINLLERNKFTSECEEGNYKIFKLDNPAHNTKATY